MVHAPADAQFRAPFCGAAGRLGSRQMDGNGGSEPAAGVEFDPTRMFPDSAHTLIGRIELEWLEAGAERVVARIPVEGNTQPFGILHGGATAALCETVASFGAGLRAGPERTVVGV